MNLTKLEKTVIIILVVGGILAAGIFLFIVPAYEKIGVAEKNLKTVQQDRQQIEEKISTETSIDEGIKESTEQAEKLEKNFYPDLTTYETVEIVLAHLKKCNLDTTGINVNSIVTSSFNISVYEPVEVIYDLKSYASVARGTDENALLEGQFRDGNKVYTVSVSGITNVTITDPDGNEVPVSKYTETMKKAHKQALCKFMSSEEMRQALGMTAATFTVTGKYGDYLKFIDYIYGLDRATYMNNVIIPLTMKNTSEEEEARTDEFGNVIATTTNNKKSTEENIEYTDDDEVTQSITIMFLSVEPMKELETINAADEKIIVNE